MRGQPTDSNYADFQWYFNCKPVALVFCSLQDQLLDQSGVWKKINCSWCWNLGKSSGRAGRFENSLRAPHSKAQRQELTLPCPVSFTPGGLWLCQDQSVLPGYCAAIAGTQPWWKGVMPLPSLTVDHIPVLHHMLMPHFLLRFQFLSWEKKIVCPDIYSPWPLGSYAASLFPADSHLPDPLHSCTQHRQKHLKVWW